MLFNYIIIYSFLFILTELTRLRGASIHAAPIQPNVRHYQDFIGMRVNLPLRYDVAIERGHIIGVVRNNMLYPLLRPGTSQWVRVRLSDNENIPILDSDPLRHRFYQEIGPGNHIIEIDRNRV